MDSDPLIANWIFEFLIRQPLDNCVLNLILRSLPRTGDSIKLQKWVLLKKLDYKVSQRPISETTLELLEHLEEIEFRRGNKAVSDALKRAYCAVAVDCTLNVLIDGDEKERNFEFFEIVRRLWRGRISQMKKAVEKGGLGSEPLWSWQSEIEAAAWDDRVCQRLINKFDGVQAEAAVRLYLREEREKMGPSFLELLAQIVKRDDGLLKNFGVNGSNATNEMHKGKVKQINKHVDVRRGARTDDADEADIEPSPKVKSSPSNVEARESTSTELRAAEKIPIPAEPLRAVKVIHAAEYSNGRPKLIFKDVAGAAQSSHDVPKPSQQKGSACTSEWDEDDTIDTSSEDKGCESVLQLHTPKRKSTAPLAIHENSNVKKRRKARKWSLQEEDKLRTRVAQFGISNWKAILNSHANEFPGRTEVDLKDKWRNMMKIRKSVLKR